jgi:MFS family permease
VAGSNRASLLIIFFTVFIDLLGFGIVLPLLPRYGKHFEADSLTLGLLMSSFSAMQFLFAPIWGRLSDRVGRRPILILGLAGSTLSYALFGLVSSLGAAATLLGIGALPWLFVSRIGAGIAGATIPTAQAYIADVTGPENRARGMAMIGLAFGIGFTFGPLLGAAFVSDEPGAAPSAAPGYVAAILSGLALLSAIFLLPESLKEGPLARETRWFDLAGFRLGLRQPAIGLILATILLTTFAFSQFETTLSLLTLQFGTSDTQQIGTSDKYNFLIYAYVGFVLTLTQGFLVRRLKKRVSESRLALCGSALMAVGLLSIGMAGRWDSRALLHTVLPICVIGFGVVSPALQALLSLKSSQTEQGRMLGVGQSISALARILGPFVGMNLIRLQDRATYAYPYWCGALVMFVGLLLVTALNRKLTSQADAPVSESSDA